MASSPDYQMFVASDDTCSEGLSAGSPQGGEIMIGSPGKGSSTPERAKTRPRGGGWRTAAVLGMVAMPLTVAGVTAVPAGAATRYRVAATIGAGNRPLGAGVDPATRTVYVANNTSNPSGIMSVINGAANTGTRTAMASTWGTAQEVPGLAALNQGGYAIISSVSALAGLVGHAGDWQAARYDFSGGGTPG